MSVNDSGNFVLREALQAAVPLWIEKYKGADFDFIRKRASVCAEVIASEGDNILFKSKRSGQTAKAFNRLAEGIACLAFMPGGVTMFDDHWEVDQEEK